MWVCAWQASELLAAARAAEPSLQRAELAARSAVKEAAAASDVLLVSKQRLASVSRHDRCHLAGILLKTVAISLLSGAQPRGHAVVCARGAVAPPDRSRGRRGVGP